MPRFAFEWPDDGGPYITYTTRHLPQPLHIRLGREAARRGISRELVVNRALDIGLARMEKEEVGEREISG